MKVALLLFGQPRFIESGEVYKNHVDLLGKYDTYTFCHYWKAPHGYDCSSWSKILSECREVANVKNVIESMYHPLEICGEQSKTFTFKPQIKEYLDSRFTGTTEHWNEKNYSNVMSQLFSIQAVSRLFEKHCKDTGNEYEWIVLARYDTLLSNLPDLNKENQEKFYLCNHHDQFPDMIFVYGKKFLEWSSNLYYDMAKVYDRVFQPSAEAFKHQAFLDRFPASDLTPYPMEAYAIRK